MRDMRTVVVEPPPELRAWLERRQALGQDLYDEVWEGDYHVAPAPHPAHGRIDDQLARLLGPLADRAGLLGHGPLNLGGPDDYRVPDRVYLREQPDQVFVPTAALVVEIVSPGDETWAKLDFFFVLGVEELLIVDPHQRRVTWLRRGPEGFEHPTSSALLGLSVEELTARLDWPPR